MKILCNTGFLVNWRNLKPPVKKYSVHTFVDIWRMQEYLKIAGYWNPIIVRGEYLVDGVLRIEAMKKLDNVPDMIPAVELPAEANVDEIMIQKAACLNQVTRTSLPKGLDRELYAFATGALVFTGEYKPDERYDALPIEILD